MQTILVDFKKISRVLRKNQTPWEKKLWQYLRGNRFYGIQFKRQIKLGNYIVDFYCASKRLVIELDGNYHNKIEVSKTDDERKRYLESQGFRVITFWNNEVEKNLPGVLQKIREEILFKTPLSRPGRDISPRQGRRI
jgi:very-short-patch-repair endonuclease